MDKGKAETALWAAAELTGAVAVVAAALVLARAVGAAGGGAAFIPHPAALAVLAVLERRRLRAWLVPRRRALAVGAGLGVLLFVFGAGYTAIATALGADVPDLAEELRGAASLPWLIAWGAGIVPVAEELYFRGRLLDGLDSRVGTAWSGAVTSAVFAAIHGSLTLFPAYCALGLILVAARRRTGSLVAPIAAHALNNLLGLLPWPF